MSVKAEASDRHAGRVSSSFESRAIVFVALNFMDYALTLRALSQGASELNPVWAWVGGYLTMQSFLIKMVVLPFLIITFFWVANQKTSKNVTVNYWFIRYGFTALNLIYLFTIIYSTVTLMAFK